jgi:hypothetical protein
VHHDPPEVTWLPPELADGTEDGELRPLDPELEELLDEEPDELLDELPELLVPLDVPEVPEPEVDGWVLLAAEPDDAWWVAPGRLNATAPAAIRLAVAAETVTARSRAVPRSRSLAPGEAPRAEPLWWWVMPASVPTGSRSLLWATSQPAMSIERPSRGERSALRRPARRALMAGVTGGTFAGTGSVAAATIDVLVRLPVLVAVLVGVLAAGGRPDLGGVLVRAGAGRLRPCRDETRVGGVWVSGQGA